jgi:hypothetical protein
MVELSFAPSHEEMTLFNNTLNQPYVLSEKPGDPSTVQAKPRPGVCGGGFLIVEEGLRVLRMPPAMQDQQVVAVKSGEGVCRSLCELPVYSASMEPVQRLRIAQEVLTAHRVRNTGEIEGTLFFEDRRPAGGPRGAHAGLQSTSAPRRVSLLENGQVQVTIHPAMPRTAATPASTSPPPPLERRQGRSASPPPLLNSASTPRSRAAPQSSRAASVSTTPPRPATPPPLLTPRSSWHFAEPASRSFPVVSLTAASNAFQHTVRASLEELFRVLPTDEARSRQLLVEYERIMEFAVKVAATEQAKATHSFQAKEESVATQSALRSELRSAAAAFDLSCEVLLGYCEVDGQDLPRPAELSSLALCTWKTHAPTRLAALEGSIITGRDFRWHRGDARCKYTEGLLTRAIVGGELGIAAAMSLTLLPHWRLLCAGAALGHHRTKVDINETSQQRQSAHSTTVVSSGRKHHAKNPLTGTQAK